MLPKQARGPVEVIVAPLWYKMDSWSPLVMTENNRKAYNMADVAKIKMGHLGTPHLEQSNPLSRKKSPGLISSGEIFVTKLKFRHYFPTNFSLIRQGGGRKKSKEGMVGWVGAKRPEN